jgi:hypothetical protein
VSINDIHFTQFPMFDFKFLLFIFDKTGGVVKVKTSFKPNQPVGI